MGLVAREPGCRSAPVQPPAATRLVREVALVAQVSTPPELKGSVVGRHHPGTDAEASLRPGENSSAPGPAASRSRAGDGGGGATSNGGASAANGATGPGGSSRTSNARPTRSSSRSVSAPIRRFSPPLGYDVHAWPRGDVLGWLHLGGWRTSRNGPTSSLRIGVRPARRRGRFWPSSTVSVSRWGHRKTSWWSGSQRRSHAAGAVRLRVLLRWARTSPSEDPSRPRGGLWKREPGSDHRTRGPRMRTTQEEDVDPPVSPSPLLKPRTSSPPGCSKPWAACLGWRNR